IASFITPNQLLEPIEMASRASNGGQRLLPTQSLLTTTPQSESLDVLIVPGLATPGPFPHQQELVAFIRAAFPYLKHIMSIGTGSMLLAEAGILDGRSATTCNALFDSATVPYRQENRAITWKTGRWVRDGNVWTASGSASALDAGAALCVEMYGEVATRKATDFMEYLPRTNSSDDPFA
ncbi:class I glutamine amidotransferase-like protein, partial [Clavulina sp. PMI_390]